MEETRIILKSDQEPAMTSVQMAIQELRSKDVMPINSLVGESECNGRAANTIRRIQEKTQALRHAVEQGITEKLQEDAPIMGCTNYGMASEMVGRIDLQAFRRGLW